MSAHLSGPPLSGGIPLGYPRIGRHRELKFALEAFWAGRVSAQELAASAAQLRRETRRRLHALGLEAETSAIPSDFSFYDQVLDAALLTDAVPGLFDAWRGEDGRFDLAGLSAIARGEGAVAPLEMTKWFDSNYHYLVPEIGPDTVFRYASDRVVEEFVEGLTQGFVTRPVVVGPVTLLLLAKPAEGAPEGFRPIDRLDEVLPVYAELLARLRERGARWVQLDEPALVSDLLGTDEAERAEFASRAYRALGAVADRPDLVVAAPYADLGGVLPALATAPVEALHLDLVRGSVPEGPVPGLESKLVIGGVVDGHNVWRTDPDAALAKLELLRPLAGQVVAGTSTSLLHVPHTLEDEHRLDPQLASWLAFADEKIGEVLVLDRALHEGREAVAGAFEEARAALAGRAANPGVHRDGVRARTAGLGEEDFHREPFAVREAAQADLDLPFLPTTTIGSFPQTADIRRTRSRFVRGEIDRETYAAEIRGHIREVIALQEELGLDVLVHGEAERNDMVQYFAEHFEGFATTENGWVQSYGSRATRPSILWGDVWHSEAFTVEWSVYAQSLTDKPVKGMLTGPVTILAWSFVRDDQPLAETANQVALALRDEIGDLEASGIGIIQVDEPALRELLPLKTAAQGPYLDWSVRAFTLATAGVTPRTQIHTHLCYSEFGEVIGAIDALDADVTSIEAARSRMEILPDIQGSGFARGIGPGVYDIHSPRVPDRAEVGSLLEAALASVDGRRLWVNPDCGLKTRGYAEVTPALRNLVDAARDVRERARVSA